MLQPVAGPSSDVRFRFAPVWSAAASLAGGAALGLGGGDAVRVTLNGDTRPELDLLHGVNVTYRCS